MDDVFRDLTGDTAGGRHAALGALEAALDDAVLWGLELEPRFRVLAATLEPTPDRYPWGDAADRRVQLLCFPVSTLVASLRRQEGDRLTVLAFTEEQLLDVVAAFDGARISAPLFDEPEPRPGAWGPEFSLEGRSGAPDGHARTLTLRLRRDELEFDAFARFDDVELRGPDGDTLPVPTDDDAISDP